MDRTCPRTDRRTQAKTGPPAQDKGGWLAAIALASLLGACSKPEPVADPPRPVRVVTARFDSVLSTARYSGEIKVRHESALSFQAGGKLVRRLVDVGTAVRRG